MPKRDYEASPISDCLGLEGVIKGLAEDIESLRSGKISVEDANARAALAKQMFNGTRIYLRAINTLAEAAKNVTPQIGDSE